MLRRAKGVARGQACVLHMKGREMITKQRLAVLKVAILLMGLVPAAMAAGPAPAPAPTKAEKAGSISALLPIAHIERGAGQKKVVSDAKKGDEIVWNDLIRTERGGRARITLNDQSILSLGSQADLRVLKHDARTQQTALSMGYGRIRAEVSKVTRQGGSFELRTPTAVAGVIGTDFGIDSSSAGGSVFVCISGLVQVSNSDPNIAGSVQCAPGLTTTVTPGKPPSIPQNATPEQIQQMIQDTEPAIITAMSPLSALPGATIDAALTGTKLGGVKSVSVSPSSSGVTVSLSGTPTDATVTVHVVIANDAAPGPRTIHLTKTSGADSAAVFTVLAPPTAVGGDLKKPYLDLFGVEGSTTAGGLSAYLANLQQAADQAIQQLQQANSANVNISGASDSFNSQIGGVQTAINTAVGQINEAVNAAGTTFTSQYDAAYQSLLQRHPDGAADDQFNQAVKAIFDSLNASLGDTFKQIRTNLDTAVAAANTGIAQTQQTWMSQITSAGNVPIPQVNGAERSIDVGAAFGGAGIAAIDASSSKGQGGASIVSYRWMLCDPSYKPAQTGVPLPGNATAGCNALTGYQSSTSDFQFQTCNLQPNDYVARVTVTDTENRSSAMDVKVHVLPAGYDDPATRVRSLAQSYMTLQTTNFLGFFDETAFTGFTALSENVRNTFPQLASMQINPRVSQAAITCNEATVRADWVQNYTYKQNPAIAFNQTEQLSIRMTRTPGKGWFITDFQGDNGTVQGQLPGPSVTDTPQPDLVAVSVFPSYVGGPSLNPPVATGPQMFSANIQNIGGADFTANTVVHFQLLDANSTPIGNGVDVPLPVPMAVGASVTLQASLDVPATLAIGASFQVLAQVNPSCTVAEAHCDNANQAVQGLIVGSPVNFKVISVAFQNHTAPYTGANAMQRNETTNLVVVVQNTSTVSATGNITLTASCTPVNPNDTTSCQGGGNPTATVPAPAAGQSITATLPVDFNGMTPGSFTGKVQLTTAIPQNSTTDDFLIVPFDVADFTITVLTPLNPQYILPGTTQNVTVQVAVQGTTGFAIPISISGGPAGVTYSPTSANLNNTSQVFTVTAAANTATGAFNATVLGTNRGVPHSVTQAVSVINPQIVPSTLLVNDANNPLAIPRGLATPTTVNLKFTGALFTGSATIVAPTSPVGFTATLNPTTAVPANGTFDLNVTATSAATNVVTPLVVTAQLPNTNPVLSITYTLYVIAASPDLQVVSATPSATFSTGSPWLDGQGVDYAVMVQNNGRLATAGNELVHIDVNGIPAGSTSLGTSLAPGGSRQVTVHAVAPDVHGDAPFSGSGTVKVKVDPDLKGDSNYANNSLTSTVAMANWHFAVNGPGTQQNPGTITISGQFPSPWSTGATFAGAVDGAANYVFNANQFNAMPGQASTSISLTNFAPGSPGFFTATAETSNNTLQNGSYFAQVIVQMLDNGVPTARRQATVWLNVSNGTPTSSVATTLTSSANNCTGTGCSSSTGTALQINGGLAEQVSITLDMLCTSFIGIAPITAPCPGVADLAIHDATNTETTPLGSTNSVPTGTPLVLRVAANMDPNGNIQAGPASGYTIGINGVQHSSAERQGASVSPDPVGQQVQMLFNVGDLSITANTGANSCTAVASGTPFTLTVGWQASGGFNVPSLSWQWENANHGPVGASPLSFSNPSGTATFGGGSYSPSPSLTLTNVAATDGVQLYFLAVTISNGTSTATKYFPFYFDVSAGQNFCGAVSSANGASRVQGSWSKSAAGFGGPISSMAARAPELSAMADVQISASDVSFTPSLPKVGDTVQLRFRLRNAGNADATGVPVALQVNGMIVASDTFDVPAGKTVLGGLNWTAQAAGLDRPTRGTRDAVREPAASGAMAMQAALVVDPQHVTRQRSTQQKSASVAHLNLRAPADNGGSAVASNSQRILIELEDGACVGLRLSSGGTMPCGSADLEITVADLAKSQLSFDTMAGVGDVGTTFERGRMRSAVRYSGQAAALSGHSYSVQLANGGTAMVNVESVRNPGELDAKARALFRASAARIMRSMGDASGAAAPGDLTGNETHTTVFIILNVQGM